MNCRKENTKGRMMKRKVEKIRATRHRKGKKECVMDRKVRKAMEERK